MKDTNAVTPEIKEETLRFPAKQERKLTREQRRLLDHYQEILEDLIEEFILESSGLDTQEDAKVFSRLNGKWSLIAHNVTKSSKPIALNVNAFANRVQELLKELTPPQAEKA